MKSTKYRTIFISDVHIGSAGSQVKALLEFLKNNSSDALYLIGDIFDFWILPKTKRWEPEYNELIRHILKRSKTSKVVYIPGNHDSDIREFVGMYFGNIEIAQDVVYESIHGDKYLLLHGDEADSSIRLHPRMARLGSLLYETMIMLNIQINRLRSIVNLKHWSFSEWLKHRVKDAIQYINRFENVIIEITNKRDCMGVICGHIHTPADKFIENTRYINCGDWISNRTAVIENHNGMIFLHKD